jgi:ankyrin repeat protein
VTALHEAILNESTDSMNFWLSRSLPRVENANFLGQTPLHLAVTNIQHLRMVLDAGYDMNVTDQWGISPLMYAAAWAVLML